ncbi:hypothetical protein AWC38_SpisGene13711 [Stylophora pistillata]|uniref:RNA-directed DNA polymerase from mobile element jockey n=1 Tax=Stylophora pistillata TaxID=50429 RepID=A0A2B4RYE2_STYPI|nr:hypothetical protein AWC38_SpisGene13711 [Stylophora pistillata]
MFICMCVCMYPVPSVNYVKGRSAISVTRIRARGLNISTSSVVPSSCQKTSTVPNKAELKKTTDLLLDAFAAPWKDREPTALSVNEIANDLDDRPPPVPNVVQVNAMLKHVNLRKATGVDGVPAWLLKRFHEVLAPVVHDTICASIVQSKYPTTYKHTLVSPLPKVDNATDINNDLR